MGQERQLPGVSEAQPPSLQTQRVWKSRLAFPDPWEGELTEQGACPTEVLPSCQGDTDRNGNVYWELEVREGCAHFSGQQRGRVTPTQYSEQIPAQAVSKPQYNDANWILGTKIPLREEEEEREVQFCLSDFKPDMIKKSPTHWNLPLG